MAPLAPIRDPAKAVDKLPQPYRLIDKILSEIIERALEVCTVKEQQKKMGKSIRVDTKFGPHAILMVSGEASCFTTCGVAGLVVVGTLQGEVYAHTARDSLAIGRDQSHTSAVTAMDTGHVSATGAKLVASASRGTLALHDVYLKTAELLPLAKVDLPVDPDAPGSPIHVQLSPNTAHVAVCWASGALAVYEVHLPESYYRVPHAAVPNVSHETAAAAAAAAAAAQAHAGATAAAAAAAAQAAGQPLAPAPTTPPHPDANRGRLQLVLHVPAAQVRSLLMGALTVGMPTVLWQLQQRPDKSGRSDRYHKPAKGVYVWWGGSNKLVLWSLPRPTTPGVDGPVMPSPSSSPATAPAGGAAATPAASPGKPPLAPSKAAPGAKGLEVAAAAAAAAAAATAAASLQRRPDKGWLLSHTITSSCSTDDGNMLAFGLQDGSIAVWDDHFGGHVKILPRMPAAVCAVSYVNGTFARLFATSTDGSVFVADSVKPENSYTAPIKLPQPASQVFFTSSDPFAICLCPGSSLGSPPRILWFHMVDQRIVAECTGKGDAHPLGFAGVLTPAMLRAQEAAAAEAAAAAVAAAPAAASAPAKAGGKNRATSAATAAAAAAAAAEAEAAAKAKAAEAEAAASTQDDIVYPRWCLKDAYLMVGGSLVKSQSFRPPPEQVETFPEDKWPKEAQTFLYKVDALARYLLPEEMQGKNAMSILDRMLADLDPPKRKKGRRVRMGVPDPDAPKPPPSAMRKAGSGDDTGSEAATDDDDKASVASMRRHITFDDIGGSLFNDEHRGEQQEKKIFKKETRGGGYSSGSTRRASGSSSSGNASPAGRGDNKAGATSYTTERPASPPWHHTNPLARIHPDWENAGVLARIMDRIASKGGGRKKRDRRLNQVSKEMGGKMAREAGAKPNLLAQG